MMGYVYLNAEVTRLLAIGNWLLEIRQKTYYSQLLLTTVFEEASDLMSRLA